MPLAAGGIGEVKPEHVDLPVVGQKFGHLVAHVFRIAAHVAALVELLMIDLIPERMKHVNGEIGMVPVNQRVVEADPQSLGPERIHDFAQQIASGRRIGNLVIGIFRIPQTESLMVLGGDDEVLHPRFTRRLGPLFRIEEIGVEEIEIDLVGFVIDLLVMANPFVPRRHRIKPPVNEHAETIVREPGGVSLAVVAHTSILSCS